MGILLIIGTFEAMFLTILVVAIKNKTNADFFLGLIVCADVSGYWLTEQQVNREVELILHSLASQVPGFVFNPVARQFNAWEVFANRFGEEGSRFYSGLTYIADCGFHSFRSKRICPLCNTG